MSQHPYGRPRHSTLGLQSAHRMVVQFGLRALHPFCGWRRQRGSSESECSAQHQRLRSRDREERVDLQHQVLQHVVPSGHGRRLDFCRRPGRQRFRAGRTNRPEALVVQYWGPHRFGRSQLLGQREAVHRDRFRWRLGDGGPPCENLSGSRSPYRATRFHTVCFCAAGREKVVSFKRIRVCLC